jgi:hypothetical protein
MFKNVNETSKKQIFRKFPSNTTKITQDGIQNKWSRPIKTSIKKR